MTPAGIILVVALFALAVYADRDVWFPSSRSE